MQFGPLPGRTEHVTQRKKRKNETKGPFDIGKETRQLPDGSSIGHVVFGLRAGLVASHQSVRQPVHSSRDG